MLDKCMLNMSSSLNKDILLLLLFLLLLLLLLCVCVGVS